MIKLIECPRDAMQGLHNFIPTEKKAAYINQLLKVGFDTIDFGSFVSPKAIPQLKDTAEVLSKLDLSTTKSKLLAIIANTRGANDAVLFEEINYLGFPFSISETFQQRNTNSSILQSLKTVEEVQTLCIKHNKKLVVYISMAFGNPYGDEWNSDIVLKWTKTLANLGIEIIALSDTVGVSNKENISYLFSNIIPEFKNIEIGAHLHTTPTTWKEKVDAAYKNGCTRFDGAIMGFGGCPMATDKLTGNMATENLITYFNELNISTEINTEAFNKSMLDANILFT
ncbi:MAG: hydroxymethylglutaryl-CoA lyase [Bacteroidetes bacterium HGW-Bacteroidetes-12]|nr:MAG: hydroxymethylglutaryl-CoA lyase [Bacteroidetes bacterium HGW-Bacteroidetes-12]